MLEALRGFGENPDTGEKFSCPASPRWPRGMGRLPALGENRLLDEVEPVGEFDLLRNGTSTDPRPDFAEDRTLRCEEHLEMKSAVVRGQGVLQTDRASPGRSVPPRSPREA